MTTPALAGGCLCGAIRIATSGEPYRIGLCHCLDCRKHTGSVFSASAIFPLDAVTITGTTAAFRNRHFCPGCGASVFATSGDEIEIQLGCLDAPNQVRPTYENWVVRREDWLPPFDLARHHDRDREGSGRSEP